MVQNRVMYMLIDRSIILTQQNGLNIIFIAFILRGKNISAEEKFWNLYSQFHTIVKMYSTVYTLPCLSPLSLASIQIQRLGCHAAQR